MKSSVGQLDIHLTDRMEDCLTGQGALPWIRKPNFGSVCCSCLCAKFDCLVARQNVLILATAHDCKIGLLLISRRIYQPSTAHESMQQLLEVVYFEWKVNQSNHVHYSQTLNFFLFITSLYRTCKDRTRRLRESVSLAVSGLLSIRLSDALQRGQMYESISSASAWLTPTHATWNQSWHLSQPT